MAATSLNCRESGEFIVSQAKYVSIKPPGIDRLKQQILKGLQSREIAIENFSQHDYHPKSDDPRASNWLFLIDTLNFCFWTPGGQRQATKWRVCDATGYFAMCAAVKRALDDGIDLTNPAYWCTVTTEILSDILRGDDPTARCPLIDERVQCLREVGTKLVRDYDGSFERCIQAAAGSAVALLQLIVREFPCFRDEAMYGGRRVSILKRAQILVGDVWACFKGVGLGQFNDIGEITMFADYRVPQVLVHFGALAYSDELMELLKKDTMLANGSEEEVEIRGASIYIVEQIKSAIMQTNPELPINSVLIDHFLWDYRRKFAAELEYIPFHKTISIFY